MVERIHRAAPQFQEDIGQSFGYTLYSTVIKGPREELELGYDCLHDRGTVFYMDGKYAGTIERSRREDKIKMPFLGVNDEIKLDILVENMGRVNYGPHMGDNKGITGVRFGQASSTSDGICSRLKWTTLQKFRLRRRTAAWKRLHTMRGELVIEAEPADTFIRLDGFHHGFVVVNGFNLGRYYNDAGPQRNTVLPRSDAEKRQKRSYSV